MENCTNSSSVIGIIFHKNLFFHPTFISIKNKHILFLYTGQKLHKVNEQLPVTINSSLAGLLLLHTTSSSYTPLFPTSFKGDLIPLHCKPDHVIAVNNERVQHCSTSSNLVLILLCKNKLFKITHCSIYTKLILF